MKFRRINESFLWLVQLLLLLLLSSSTWWCNSNGAAVVASFTIDTRQQQQQHRLYPRRLMPSSSSSSVSTATTRLFLLTTKGESMFSNTVYDLIQNGKIAVIPDFLSESDLMPLKRDAMNLYTNHYFSTDALSSYGDTNKKFDPAKDRTVLKLSQWKNMALGDYTVRDALGAKMEQVRSDFARQLDRPGLNRGSSIALYGRGSAEISYTRFGPGAYLQRHVDEHHEELKGVAGWSQPTRRSLSWLIYLNENWNPDLYGGCLRCFERSAVRPSHPVGSRSNGDLQIGWLRPTNSDPMERPVFLDAQHRGDDSTASVSNNHYCAMYIDDPRTLIGSGDAQQQRLYITSSFNAYPTLFVAGGGEWWIQNVLMQQQQQQQSILGQNYASRFTLIETPKSVLSDWWNNNNRIRRNSNANNDDESPIEIAPIGGTLVVFDSVTLPHEVLPTISRERWAISGWMHEDQQPIDTHPHYNKV